MFLDVIRRRNPHFITAAQKLHQEGLIPSNTYMLDLDAIESNARVFKAEADKLNLKVFAMTKQVSRNSGFVSAVMRGGIERAVAVDMACALACHRAGLKIGHLGHLVQIPKAEAAAAATMKPDYWTVFSLQKAEEAAAASRTTGREQELLLRVQTAGDTFYRGHEGGFAAEQTVDAAAQVSKIKGSRFAGITTFPAQLYDNATRKIKHTPNLTTLARTAEALRKAGYEHIEINAPGTTSTVTLKALAEAGATQVEPGNGLHGTTPLHAVEDLPELPAVLYVTEVSHQYGDLAYCFGGGLYIDPVFPDYDVKALVSSAPTTDGDSLRSVEVPVPSAIDYYGMIKTRPNDNFKSGDTVVFGFRGQAFVTRANVAAVSGIASGNPKVVCIEDCFGQTVAWPPRVA
ncbi:alanine racemase [Aestuariivirga litoralis]|uniref:alanine racemase n=1 Tax=Aestuariivirga litoralis TaxID=2650924 RepID=UPI0018C5614C|nr:alanine racemase [Aestuariivirga litoralis]MBG1233918.1 YhfX family PLP-dependent enzyme [Aestuariivirga litoralis]